MVTSNLSPSTHIHDVASRAHNRALAIHCSFASRVTSVLVHCIITLMSELSLSTTLSFRLLVIFKTFKKLNN